MNANLSSNIFPITGSGFVFSFAAFMIPITSKTNKNKFITQVIKPKTGKIETKTEMIIPVIKLVKPSPKL